MPVPLMFYRFDHDQQVDLIKRQHRHQPLSLRTQLRLPGGDGLSWDNLEPRSAVRRVFNQRHSAENRGSVKNHSGQILNDSS